jgi:hypothetical protein
MMNLQAQNRLLGAAARPPDHLRRLKTQGLWWRVEAQPGPAEANVDEFGSALDLLELTADDGLQLVHGPGSAVAPPLLIADQAPSTG